MCQEAEEGYEGPQNLEADLEVALRQIGELLTPGTSVAPSHSVLATDGFRGAVVLQATSVYLVAAIAKCIAQTLEIRRALFDEATIQRDLYADVSRVIGENNEDEDFNQTQRDPWIWEGISHMLLHASRLRPDFHPPGRLLATTGIKLDVHNHGLDVIALYDAEQLGITTGECKAYLTDPASGIYEAAQKLQEVDAGRRDGELREAISDFLGSLTPETQDRVAGAFWRDERSQLPLICCDAGHAVEWARDRKCLRDIAVPISHKFLTPLPITEARDQFNSISDRMRAYVLGGDQDDV